ncbi:GntR family transcriptional regulator [Rhodobacteraceae bacterium CCMM004]|nr:GntR family transcriptional regulator [Rhodobacteraceae bacterium CCMM004]
MNAPHKQPAAEAAYHAIRRAIVTGSLAEGERLTETRLADDLGLSRTPVREAISRLILEGFVERQQGYTTRVASFPEDEVAQIFEIRRMLEGYAAARAAVHATDEEVARLDALCTRMAGHLPPRGVEDSAAIAEINADFHRTIAEAARSPRLTALMSLAVDVGMVTRTYGHYSDEDLARSQRHHREIADAIAARSPDWAEAAMAAHLMAGAAAALRA